MKKGEVMVMRKSTITEDKKKEWWNGTLFEDDLMKLAIEKGL